MDLTGLDDRPVPGDSRWLLDPPANDGRKVVLSDTDHYSPFESTALWAWKSFLRGHNPILYDLGIIGGAALRTRTPGTPSFNSLEAARYAMGETRRFADLVDLAFLEPRGDLTSTGYALAHPGHEYLALKPDDGEPALVVTLSPGSYAARWHDVDSRRTIDADSVTTDHGTRHVPQPVRPPARGLAPHLNSSVEVRSSGRGQRLAAGHRRNDRDPGTIAHLGVQPANEAHVVVPDVDIDEPAEHRPHPECEHGCRDGSTRVKDLAQLAAFCADLSTPV